MKLHFGLNGLFSNMQPTCIIAYVNINTSLAPKLNSMLCHCNEKLAVIFKYAIFYRLNRPILYMNSTFLVLF